jgi:hypothetical protein
MAFIRYWSAQRTAAARDIKRQPLSALTYGEFVMMKKIVPALAAAAAASVMATSGADAAVINFAVSVLDGAGLGFTGATLDKSSAFNFDGSSLLVSSLGPGDASGLSPFPTPPDTVGLAPTVVDYGSGTGSGPLAGDVTKSWTGASGDKFTELLTAVLSINRATPNAITVTLTGTVSDSDLLFVGVPIRFIFSANQVGGPGTAIGAGFTNTTVVPEPSTWVMLGLGFVGLGFAAVRRAKAQPISLV